MPLRHHAHAAVGAQRARVSGNYLSAVRIENIRILERAELNPVAGFNLITGANASGKTSVLESIFLLSRGRSFRSLRFGDVVRHGAERYSVVGWIAGSGRKIPLGIERNAEQLTVRVDGRPATSRAELTTLLPVQLINPLSHKLLEEGPVFRRRYLDWGVFHVEPGFLHAWQRFQRALRQRNGALRSYPDTARAWDSELIAAGMALDDLRRRYVADVAPYVHALARRLADVDDLELRYQRGWPQDRDLAGTLDQQWPRDRERGHTGSGPHRAEIRVRVEGRDAVGCVSRGQQKLLVAALILGQTQWFQERTGRRAIVLLDDLPAELDRPHRERLVSLLDELQPQVFVTAIDPDEIPVPDTARRFHVEHGQVGEMV